MSHKQRPCGNIGARQQTFLDIIVEQLTSFQLTTLNFKSRTNR